MDTEERVLRDFSTLAVVGASRHPEKAAFSVPSALQAAGFRVIPVNPEADTLFGERAYPTLAAVPEPVEVVLVFRPSEEAPRIAEEAVGIGAKALWLQLGLKSEEARRIAEGAGLLYVEDRCMGVERSRRRISKR
jgi:predicted CoA-binding protein